MGERVDLWNNSWLKDDLVKSMPVSSIVNSETLGKVTPVITFRETRAYYDVINEENNDEHNIP
jgi:hypothetical protein